MDNNMFSSRLREAREKKGITVKELQKTVGVSPSAMSHYSTGATLPTLDVAARIADALGVSLDWLCGLQEKKENAPKGTCGFVVRRILECEKTLLCANQGGGLCLVKTSLDTEVASLIIEDDNIVEFVKKREKFKELAEENIEAKEMYEAWISGALNKLDNIEIDYFPF